MCRDVTDSIVLIIKLISFVITTLFYTYFLIPLRILNEEQQKKIAIFQNLPPIFSIVDVETEVETVFDRHFYDLFGILLMCSFSVMLMTNRLTNDLLIYVHVDEESSPSAATSKAWHCIILCCS